MAEELSKRNKLIFAALVANYIATAEPVGSRTISRQSGIDVSAATVRNVMSDLEDMGFLEQPHVSAGRVPTASGLKFYVDHILKVEDLDEAAKHHISLALDAQQASDLSDILRTAGKALSQTSRLVAVVAAPDPEQELFRHIEFIRLGRGVILVVLVSRGGVVQNRVIEVSEEISQEDLDKYTRYLNQLLADLTLSQVKQRVAQEKAREKNRFDQLLSRALNLGDLALAGGVSGEVFIEGQTNLLDAPEFAEAARLRNIFRAFEEKSTLLGLLEKAAMAQGVQVLMGSDEGQAELDGLSAVATTYGGDESPAGALGVIGPTRMDYSKVIAAVEFTAKAVTKILDQRGRDD